MATLIENTVVVNPETGQPVLLAATGELPDWADGLVGDHLLSDAPAPKAREDDENARLRARIAELEEAQRRTEAAEAQRRAEAATPAKDGYDGMTAAQLGDELADRKLAKSGSRPELIARLRADDQTKADTQQ
jgi:hypothetical protein